MSNILNENEKIRISLLYEDKGIKLHNLLFEFKEFSNQTEGNKFRFWVNSNYPDIAKKLQLDTTGSYNNFYIKNAMNYKVKDKTLYDIYTSQWWNAGNKKVDKDLQVSYDINPVFMKHINFKKLQPTYQVLMSGKGWGNGNCAQFVNDFSTKTSYVGDAWMAYLNNWNLGETVFSNFKNLNDNEKKQAISLYQKIHNYGGPKENGQFNSAVSAFVSKLANKGKPSSLELDDYVGIYYPPSKHHEEAFYYGGEDWFKTVDGKKVSNGKIDDGGWGMNTHVGIVGAIVKGVPLVFHNIAGIGLIAQPASQLNIVWVKRSPRSWSKFAKDWTDYLGLT